MVVKLFIEEKDGKITEIEMSDAEHERCTVLQLERRTRHRDRSQLLFFNDCLLEDAAKLSDYGIKHESTIHSYTKITIFIINERGKTFEIRLDKDEFKSCLVLDLKRRLHAEEGTPDCSQLLFFNDRLLEDAAKLSDYGIQHKSTIILFVKSTKPTIFIKTLTGKTFAIRLNEDEFKSCLVLDLKSRIRAIEGIPEDEQRLIYSGKQLEDSCTLSDYEIHDNSIIHLIPRLRGGWKEGLDSGEEDGGMGDKGGKNRSMEHLSLF